VTAPVPPLLLPRRNSPLSRNDFSKASPRKRPIEWIEAIHGNDDMAVRAKRRDEGEEGE
jgi:hypothetical protein